MSIDSKKIAKNTLFMYFRMLVIMFVTIYTSRVVLDKLGVNDFGLYNAITSVVALVIFLSDTLTTTTSRFITYDLGRGDKNILKTTFSTSVYLHFFLSILIIVLLETVGLAYMNYKFVTPAGKETATMVVYQLSILMTAITVSLIPYGGLITAHENFRIYAYVSIAEALANLCVVYFLSIVTFDKLIFYSLLLCSVKVVIAFIYVSICRNLYEESNLILVFDTITFKRMFGFTSWTAIANLSNTFTVQGSIILLNQFFSPIVIAAKALADQVTAAIIKFVVNFRLALNPQLIKTQAEGNEELARKLTLKSTIISFDLVVILGLPCYFTMSTLLNLWLIEVPEYAVAFAKVAILSQIVSVLSTSTYIPFIASGKLKSNAICGLLMGILFFITLYLIFIFGGGAIWVQYLYLLSSLLSVLIIRPYLLNKELGYSYKDLFRSYLCATKVIIVSMILSYLLSSFCYFKSLNILPQAILFVLICLISAISSYIFLDRDLKKNLKMIISNKFIKK